MTKYLTDSSRKQKMKIAVFGTGYVGLSLSVLLAQKNEVVAVDVLEKKVELINKKISPIVDAKLQSFLLSFPEIG